MQILNTSFNYLETNSENYSINKFINNINLSLVKYAFKKANTYIFDINEIILNYGYKTIFDERMWYLAKSPFSKNGSKYLAEELLTFLNCITQASKKY